MKPELPNDDELAELVDAHLRGELSADEKLKLAEILDSSEEAQNRFIELVEFETALTQSQCEHLAAEPSPGNPARAKWARLSLWSAPWLMTAICLFFLFGPKPEGSDKITNSDSPGTLQIDKGSALLVNYADAVLTGHEIRNGTRFDQGQHVLQSGSLHLQFDNNVDLLIDGPARFEIIDNLNLRLEFGTIRAIIPPRAQGFNVVTRSSKFEDISTEFGLKIDRNSGAESLVVFDGQVNVRHPGSASSEVETLRGGQVWHSGEGSSGKSVRPESFPNPAKVGYLRWYSNLKTRLISPGLIALYDFEPDPDQATLLGNIKRGDPVATATDATIHGARRVSGRWPGKGALLFDTDTDFAELEVEGEFEELTIAAWVFVNRLAHPLNAIFNSNGWGTGDVHLQISRSGAAYADIFYPDREFASDLMKNRKFFDSNKVCEGKWTHLVATFSRAEQKVRVYVNGEAAYDCPLDSSGLISPGTCRIGNWLTVGSFAPVRSLNGRIDELAIWNRALTNAEIQIEMELGSPGFLWQIETGTPTLASTERSR